MLPGGASLAYKRLGELSPAKDNVILHPTSFDATHEDLLYNVGPGRLLDTERYHIVIVNLLGNGMSTAPSNTGAPLPLVTLYDNVRAQRLLLDSLGLATSADDSPPLALIYGYSMGAMQALQWGCLFPGQVARIAAVCGAARCGAFNTVSTPMHISSPSSPPDPPYSAVWCVQYSSHCPLRAGLPGEPAGRRRRRRVLPASRTS